MCGSLISIVVASYNELDNMSKLIPELEAIFCEESVQGEIVVVDDNSPDGTATLVRRLSSQYGNIRLLVRPKKLGPGSAFADPSANAEPGPSFFGRTRSLIFPYWLLNLLTRVAVPSGELSSTTTISPCTLSSQKMASSSGINLDMLSNSLYDATTIEIKLPHIWAHTSRDV